MAFVGPVRPARRWHHASTTLDDFVVVTFRVETERLRRRVPAEFTPTELSFGDGTSGSLVSVVAFIERDFAFRFAPFVRISGPLVDYRAYGSVGDEVGVYVFRTSLDHALVSVPRVLWKMPWTREHVEIAATWRGTDVRFGVTDRRTGGLELRLAGTGDPVGDLDGFAGADAAIGALTHPLVGWYGETEHVRRYSVWHDVLPARSAIVEHACVPVFAELDLVTGDAPVHSGLVVPTARFDIHTPPTRVR